MNRLILNYRSLVMILEDRWVDAKHFLELQEQAVAKIRSAPDDFSSLRSLFQMHSLGQAYSLTNIITRLSELGVDLRAMKNQIQQSPFFSRVARCSVNILLRDMKYRCRIPVPKSWKLAGVVDEGPRYEESGENGSREVFSLNERQIFGE